ncbi:DUF2637 domain-containing protein [Streptomyces sp. 891-h]|uniref:DUF2637 domain-containing protein n=1 Tax=Streptomyces sp. 891-h TaxID=2720714 RepID=UPI001FA96C58|nr:DUF2637 domain-containing protein [Streptomyces sp. 891-h]UNZ18174.1 DUF2637 domain-containing protein [Streptomyces sp. 891-h]
MSTDRIEARSAENGMTGWDYGAIIALATVGFFLSYDALRQVAVAIHVRPSLSYFFPVVVDGFIAYGVRAIVLLRNRPFGARLYAWFLFLAATRASLWANALHAITLNRGPLSGRSALHLGDAVVGALSMLAPLALAGSVHLYILMARTVDSSVRDHAGSGPGLTQNHVSFTADDASTVGNGPLLKVGETPSASATALGPPALDKRTDSPVELRKDDSQGAGTKLSGETDKELPARSGDTHHAPDDGSGPPSSDGADRPNNGEKPAAATTDYQPVQKAVRDHPDGEEPPVQDSANSLEDRETDDAWLGELLPIARAASEQAGRISRDAVKDAVRAHQPIGNERLGMLLARLKQEEEDAAQSPACASASLR